MENNNYIFIETKGTEAVVNINPSLLGEAKDESVVTQEMIDMNGQTASKKTR